MISKNQLCAFQFAFHNFFNFKNNTCQWWVCLLFFNRDYCRFLFLPFDHVVMKKKMRLLLIITDLESRNKIFALFARKWASNNGNNKRLENTIR